MAIWTKKRTDTAAPSRRISPEELFSTAKRYVLQETVLPLKQIAKVLGFGAAGAVVFALGAVIALVGVLRVLQTETGTFFAGSWSFAPYLLTAAVGIATVPLVGAIFVSSLHVGEDPADTDRVA